ncbi:hypothetical protein E2F47_13480 [Mycobacterium eburneum]|nr:hypothetical protein [Mycobacterium eburneum]TDH52875.1 hypothetical protein E2F47_13480 [Mycobacterium eburneum]
MAEHVDPTTELTAAPGGGDAVGRATADANGAEAVDDDLDTQPSQKTPPINTECRQRRWRRKPFRGNRSPASIALAGGAAMVITLGSLGGYLGYQLTQQHRSEDQRNLFLQVAKQGAVNLTTIDWQHADADVARILDSATGQFYDDFSKRSKPFVDVVKQAQSRSEGSITEAGVESETGDAAQVLVAVTVKTTNAAAAQQDPRRWRMRLTVQKTGPDAAKVSDVVFVP